MNIYNDIFRDQLKDCIFSSNGIKIGMTRQGIFLHFAFSLQKNRIFSWAESISKPYSCIFDIRRIVVTSVTQQLHLTTPRGSGLRQIKYFKLNRGRDVLRRGHGVVGRIGGRTERVDADRGERKGGTVAVGESGAFSFLICLSLFLFLFVLS